MSTAHKAKGLEWPTVRIGTDFRQPLDKRTNKPLPIPREEAMLAYVAVTRAMEVLDVGGLGWVHNHLDALGHSLAMTVHPQSAEQPAPLVPIATACSASAPNPTPPAVSAAPSLAASGSINDPDAGPTGAGVIIGQLVGVDGEIGTWRVTGMARDGSLTCVGGPSKQWRSFMPEWCYPAERRGRDGKTRPGKLPTAQRGLRAAWAMDHGLPSRVTSTSVVEDPVARPAGVEL